MNDVAMKPAESDAEVAIVFDEAKALQVLTDPKQFQDFYEKVKTASEVAEPDVTTAKGRDEIRSAARKVVSTKTKIVATAKTITEGWRAKTAAVNKTRDEIEEKLAELAAEIRKPLTVWEEADKARKADVTEKLKQIEGAALVTLEDTVESIERRIQEIGGIEITDEWFDEFAAAARAQQDRTLEALRAARERLRREAAEREELEALRRANAQREYVDSLIAHIRACGLGTIGGQAQPFGILLRELEEKVEIDDRLGDRQAEVRQLRDETLAKLKADMAAESEQRRQRDEQEAAEAEARRQTEAREASEAAAAAAEQRARDEERQRAEDERREQDRVAHVSATVERLKAAAVISVDDTIATLGDRIGAIGLLAISPQVFKDQADAVLEQKMGVLRTLAEAKKRLEDAAEEERVAAQRRADQEHRAAVKSKAKEALMAVAGLKEEAAKKVVLAIIAGEVPAVTLTF